MIFQKDNMSIKININTKNSIVRQYIEQLLKKMKYITMYLSNNDRYIISLKNERNQEVYINCGKNDIYIKNTTKYKIEELKYNIYNKMTKIEINKVEKMKETGMYQEINTCDEEYIYNRNDIPIYHKYTKNNTLYNNFAKKLSTTERQSNYIYIIEDINIGNNLIRKKSIEYEFYKEGNRTDYYESIYQNGVKLSKNDTANNKPIFRQISEEEYNDKYGNYIEKTKQKTKKMM